MNKIQIFTSSGTFTVPSGVTCIKVTQIGAGGAGSAKGGGGSGSWCMGVPIKVTPGQALAVTVGAKGIADVLADIHYGSTAGGDSIVGPIRVGGGGAPYAQDGNPSFPRSGTGGGYKGGDGVGANETGLQAPRTTGQPTLPLNGGQNSILFWGGGSGGGAPGAGNPDGGAGAASINGITGGDGGGPYVGGAPDPYCGGGGASSPWGKGAMGGNYWNPPQEGHNAVLTHYGAGGGSGMSNYQGGNGAGGLVWIEWTHG